PLLSLTLLRPSPSSTLFPYTTLFRSFCTLSALLIGGESSAPPAPRGGFVLLDDCFARIFSDSGGLHCLRHSVAGNAPEKFPKNVTFLRPASCSVRDAAGQRPRPDVSCGLLRTRCSCPRRI